MPRPKSCCIQRFPNQFNCLCTWFRRHKALCPGCRAMECSHDILDAEPSHERNPRQPRRLPAPVPRRRRLRPMAERLPVSRLCRSGSGSDLVAMPGCSPPSFAAPGLLRLATIPSCDAKDLGNFAVRSTAATAIVKTDGCSAVPRDSHRSQVVGDRPPPVKFLPGSTPRSATSMAGLGASATGCAPNLTPAAS